MSNIESEKSELKMYGLVRDKNGRPVIDDGDSLPEQILLMLTKNELKEIKNDRFTFRRC